MLKRIFKSTIQKSSAKKQDELSVKSETNNTSTITAENKIADESITPPSSTIPDNTIVPGKIDNSLQEETKNLEITPEPIQEIPEKVAEEKKASFHEIERKLKEFNNEAENLTVSTNWEPAHNAFNELAKKWEETDIKDEFKDLKKHFEESLNKFNRRYENHAKIKLDIKVREELCTQIEKLIEKANSEESLSLFKEIQKQWNNAEEIPPRYFEILEKKYKTLVSDFKKEAERLKLEKEEQKNKEQMIQENEPVPNDLSTEKTIIDNETEQEKQTVKHTSPQNTEEFIKNIEELLNLLKQYTDTDNTKSALNNIKEIQEKWENIENGPTKKKYSNQFKKLFKDYFSKLKFIQQKENWQRWENYTNKHLLCEQAENLLDENDLYKVSKEIKAIWEKWRTIGRAPKEKNDIIWNRFNKTRRELNRRCKDFFNNLQKEREISLETKIKLCEDAEKLKDSEDWESTANELKDIQIRWKEAGRAPQPQDDELYQRLRTVCNYFFEKRSSHYNKLHERQAVHKERKKELCNQADELVNLPWKEAFKKIKDYKNLWHTIPPAGRKDEQALWTRFNKSIDDFIAKIEKERPKNLEKKNSIYDEASMLLESIKPDCILKELGQKIENICLQWKQTGPAPKEQDYELNSLFEKKMNELRNSYNELIKQEKSVQIKNHLQKENLIDKLEKTVAEAITDNNINNCLDAVKQIELEWKSIITEPKEKEDELIEKRFNEVSEAFYKGQEDFFINHSEIRKNNLNTKRKLCIQLEHLAEIDVPNDMINTHKSHTLADEIKFSIENNFATRENKTSDDILLKYRKIKNDWNNTGPVPIDYYEKIHMRYQRACQSLEQKLKE